MSTLIHWSIWILGIATVGEISAIGSRITRPFQDRLERHFPEIVDQMRRNRSIRRRPLQPNLELFIFKRDYRALPDSDLVALGNRTRNRLIGLVALSLALCIAFASLAELIE